MKKQIVCIVFVLFSMFFLKSLIHAQVIDISTINTDSDDDIFVDKKLFSVDNQINAKLQEINYLKSKIWDSVNIIELDPRLDITNLFAQLTQKIKELKDLNNERSSLETKNEDINDSRDGSLMKLTGNLSINTNNSSEILSPKLAFDYTGFFSDSLSWTKDFHYKAHLSVKSPSKIQDTARLINSSLLQGGDGTFMVGILRNIGNETMNIKLMLSGSLNWILKNELEPNQSTSAFAFTALSPAIMITAGPLVFGYECIFRWVTGERNSLLSKELNKAMSQNIFGGLKTKDFAIQLRYLVNSNKSLSSDDNLLIGLMYSYNVK